MSRVRVIPVLLLRGAGLVKTRRFRDPTYIGDPINAVRIFNDKEVDELAFLDITATSQGRSPDLRRLEEIAGECFMPLCYGGGVRTLEDVQQVLAAGVEKVAMNSGAFADPRVVERSAAQFGSQSIVVSIDVKRSLLGKPSVWTQCGRVNTRRDPVEVAREMEGRGAGEILLNSIDRDGTMSGYDLDVLGGVCEAVDIPVIACGGAAEPGDFARAVNEAGAAAVAAGSLFVFHGKHRAVLINVPPAEALQEAIRGGGQSGPPPSRRG